MVTFDDQKYVTLHEAAKLKRVSYGAMQLWVWRHKVPRRTIGRNALVKSTDLAEYQPHSK